MRILVFLLIPINLLFFLWAGGYLGKASSTDSTQQLLADRIRVVSRDEPPVMPVKLDKPTAETPAQSPVPPPTPVQTQTPEQTPTPAQMPEPRLAVIEKTPEPKPSVSNKVPEICLSLSDLQPSDLKRVEKLLSENFPTFSTKQIDTAVKNVFWVFIPPRANRQEAERKSAELKQLHVPEFFIIQDSGPHRFAISLGIFSTESAAQERLALLKELGVRSAVVGSREKQPHPVSLEIKGPETQSDALSRALSAALSSKKPTACRTTRARNG